jgi:hypothetical protein
MLRISGALVGAAMGFLTIMLLVPRMESITSLALVVAAGTAVAAWVILGSPRIAYAGVQIAFAFYVCVIQGFRPSWYFYDPRSSDRHPAGQRRHHSSSTTSGRCEPRRDVDQPLLRAAGWRAAGVTDRASVARGRQCAAQTAHDFATASSWRTGARSDRRSLSRRDRRARRRSAPPPTPSRCS